MSHCTQEVLQKPNEIFYGLDIYDLGTGQQGRRISHRLTYLWGVLK